MVLYGRVCIISVSPGDLQLRLPVCENIFLFFKRDAIPNIEDSWSKIAYSNIQHFSPLKVRCHHPYNNLAISLQILLYTTHKKESIMDNNKTMIVETDSKGIPLKHVGYPDSISVATFYVVGNVVMGGIGLTMAWFLAYNPTEAKRAIVDAKISILV